MSTPFLMLFKKELEVLTGEEFEFAAWYSNAHTASRYRKGYRSKSNKWVPGKRLPSKTDRRSGK
jgi:hypothetical protein